MRLSNLDQPDLDLSTHDLSTHDRHRRVRGVAARFVVVMAMLCLGVGPLAACKKKADERMGVRLLLIDVDPAAKSAAKKVGREHLRELVRGQMVSDENIDLKEGAPKGVTFRVRLAPAKPGDASLVPLPGSTSTASSSRFGGGPSGLELTLEASIDQSHNGGETFHYKGISVSDTNGALPLDMTLQNMFREALDQVLLARRARDLDDKTLVSWLAPKSAASTDQKKQAVRVLGARKSEAAIPNLIAVLGADDRMLAVHALGALSSATPTGQNRTKVVNAIIDYAEAKPTIIRKQAIAAVGRIDAPIGRAWLWTMSGGHPDEDVQMRARNALAGLDPSVFADDVGQSVARKESVAQ